MFNKADPLAHAMNCLVGVAGCVADPSGVTAAGAAVTGYLSLREVFSSAGASDLATELARDVRAALKSGAELPGDAEVLLPQMIEQGLPHPSKSSARTSTPMRWSR